MTIIATWTVILIDLLWVAFATFVLIVVFASLVEAMVGQDEYREIIRESFSIPWIRLVFVTTILTPHRKRTSLLVLRIVVRAIPLSAERKSNVRDRNDFETHLELYECLTTEIPDHETTLRLRNDVRGICVSQVRLC